MIKLSLKDRYAKLDSDQRAVLWCFLCITGVTFLSGSIVTKHADGFLFSFMISWFIFTFFFGRKNIPKKENGKYVTQNGKEFTIKDQILYGLFFAFTFFVGVIISGYINVRILNSDSATFLALYIPYTCCAIYGFIKKMPIHTFLTPSEGYKPSSSSKSLSESFSNDMLYSPLYSGYISNIYHRRNR